MFFIRIIALICWFALQGLVAKPYDNCMEAKYPFKDLDLSMYSKRILQVENNQKVFLSHQKDFKKVLMALQKSRKKKCIPYRYYLYTGLGFFIFCRVVAATHWYISLLQEISDMFPRSCKDWFSSMHQIFAEIKNCFAYNPFDFFNINGRAQELADLCNKHAEDLALQHRLGHKEYCNSLEQSTSKTLSAMKKQQQELTTLHVSAYKKFEQELSMVNSQMQKKFEEQQKKMEQAMNTSLQAQLQEYETKQSSVFEKVSKGLQEQKDAMMHGLQKSKDFMKKQADAYKEEQASFAGSISDQLKKTQASAQKSYDALSRQQQEMHDKITVQTDDMYKKMIESLQKHTREQLEAVRVIQTSFEKKIEERELSFQKNMLDIIADQLKERQKELLASMALELQKQGQQIHQTLNSSAQVMQDGIKKQLEDALHAQTEKLLNRLAEDIQAKLSQKRDLNMQHMQEVLSGEMKQYHNEVQKAVESIQEQHRGDKRESSEKSDHIMKQLTEQIVETKEKILQSMNERLEQHKKEQSALSEEAIQATTEKCTKSFEDRCIAFKNEVAQQYKEMKDLTESLKKELQVSSNSCKASQQELKVRCEDFVRKQGFLERDQAELESELKKLKQAQEKAERDRASASSQSSYARVQQLTAAATRSTFSFCSQMISDTLPSAESIRMLQSEAKKL